MNTIVVFEDWIQHGLSSILISLQTIYYILLVILLVLPLFVGIVTIIRIWCLSLLRTFLVMVFPLVSANEACACRTTNVRVLILEENSALLFLLQKQRTSPNYLIKSSDANPKNALARVPTRKFHHGYSMTRKEEIHSAGRAWWSKSSIKSVSRSGTGKPLMNRTEYLDLSLRKYADTPQKLYKDEKPIYFKFVADL